MLTKNSLDSLKKKPIPMARPPHRKKSFYLLLSLFLIFSTGVFAGPKGKKSARLRCLQSGGNWGTWSKYDAINNIYTCLYKAKDAGTICKDGKECSTNLCEYNSQTKKGQCAEDSRREGCHSWMSNGTPQASICIN